MFLLIHYLQTRVNFCMNKSVKYIPEIDELRGLAVLAVVIYHLNPSWLRGGYIGVDVFFVISGFFDHAYYL